MHGAFAVSFGSHDAWKNGSKNFMKSHLNFSIKFGYSEKATKFEKIFHLKFDVTD